MVNNLALSAYTLKLTFFVVYCLLNTLLSFITDNDLKRVFGSLGYIFESVDIIPITAHIRKNYSVKLSQGMKKKGKIKMDKHNYYNSSFLSLGFNFQCSFFIKEH